MSMDLMGFTYCAGSNLKVNHILANAIYGARKIYPEAISVSGAGGMYRRENTGEYVVDCMINHDYCFFLETGKTGLGEAYAYLKKNVNPAYRKIGSQRHVNSIFENVLHKALRDTCLTEILEYRRDNRAKDDLVGKLLITAIFPCDQKFIVIYEKHENSEEQLAFQVSYSLPDLPVDVVSIPYILLHFPYTMTDAVVIQDLTSTSFTSLIKFETEGMRWV